MPVAGTRTEHDACPRCSSTRFTYQTTPRVKCADCGRYYNGSDALRAQRAAGTTFNDVAYAARKGYAPDYDMVKRAAPGFMVKGTSTAYRPDGTVSLQWVKTTQDAEAMAVAMGAAIEAMTADLPRVAPRRASGTYLDDLLVGYPIGDPHVGMYSWREETGEDWDLALARAMHCRAMATLVTAAPAARTALITNLGDLFHYDSMESKTPRSGHFLDADGRYAKVIDVGVMMMRQCIESALEKHERVHIINVRGNHDETGAMWLARLLAVAYENEPRVTVDTSPSVFNYYRWGKVLLGMHHGHACRPEKLPGVMAADRARDWGECAWRYWWQGHIHHESKKEFPGVSVESFNTLAAKDAYAAEGGWRSARLMQAIVYHRDHGEVGRSRVNAAMFEDT